MSRLLDLKPDEEADVVNRIVMQIHKAMEDLTGENSKEGENLRKTVFNQNEDTLVERPNKVVQTAEIAGHGQDIDTDPLGEAKSFEHAQAMANAVTKSPVDVTQQAELEYSSMSSMGADQPGTATGKKLLFVAVAVIVMTSITALMLYNLLDP